MKKEDLKEKIQINIDEQKNVIKKSKSLSDAALKLMNTNSTLGRTIIKELCKEYNLPLPRKQKTLKYCLYCGKEITEMRGKFCSHSCSAKYNNKNIHKKTKKCKNCGALIENRKTYCDIKCFDEYRVKQSYKKWINGRFVSEYTPNSVRNFMFMKHNNKCEKCGWGEINSYTNKIPLQIHHIDGDCTNNKEENLQLLCPNCHSLTETYGGLNKGNGKRTKRNEKRKI